jgi:hypothetical protein
MFAPLIKPLRALDGGLGVSLPYPARASFKSRQRIWGISLDTFVYAGNIIRLIIYRFNISAQDIIICVLACRCKIKIALKQAEILDTFNA